MKFTFKFTIALLAALVPALAIAHPGHEESATFMSGFLHPLLGFDHILAAVAVGLLAAQGRTTWRASLPATFVCCMLAGFLMAPQINAWPAAEILVAGSLVALGAASFLGARAKIFVVAAVAVFGALHGYVHGAEMPGAGNLVGYVLGLMLATAMAHALGLFIGTRVDPRLKLAAKFGAAFIAATGTALLGMQLIG